MFHKKLIVFAMVFVIAVATALPAFAADYTVIFKDKPPMFFDWGCPSPVWYNCNSKWAQPRTSGSSPHIGVDILSPFGTEVLAVDDGMITHDGTYTVNLVLTADGTGNYVCRYRHLSHQEPVGYVSKGDKIGESGNENGLYGSHLHFVGVHSGLKHRTEMQYRWTTEWTTNIERLTPETIIVWHRKSGTSTWTNGGSPTALGNFRYEYNFANKYPSGTTIEWMITYKRSGVSQWGTGPAKFTKPDSNPNATIYKYDFWTNTVTY